MGCVTAWKSVRRARGEGEEACLSLKTLQVAGIMAGMAPHIKEEVVLGEANILQLFPTKEKHLSEKVVIAGCRVDSGNVKMGEQFRVVRDGEAVWTGTCRSMKRLKLEVRQVGKVRLCLSGLLWSSIASYCKAGAAGSGSDPC